jgi:hypothetical protein
MTRKLDDLKQDVDQIVVQFKKILGSRFELLTTWSELDKELLTYLSAELGPS